MRIGTSSGRRKRVPRPRRAGGPARRQPTIRAAPQRARRAAVASDSSSRPTAGRPRSRRPVGYRPQQPRRRRGRRAHRRATATGRARSAASGSPAPSRPPHSTHSGGFSHRSRSSSSCRASRASDAKRLQRVVNKGRDRRVWGLFPSAFPRSDTESDARYKPLMDWTTRPFASGLWSIMLGGDYPARRQADVLAPRGPLLGTDVPENLVDIVTAPGSVLIPNGPQFINDRVGLLRHRPPP